MIFYQSSDRMRTVGISRFKSNFKYTSELHWTIYIREFQTNDGTHPCHKAEPANSCGKGGFQYGRFDTP